jgi:hypothetical protein
MGRVAVTHSNGHLSPGPLWMIDGKEGEDCGLNTYDMFVWLISHQPAVFFSQKKPATSNQPAVLFF